MASVQLQGDEMGIKKERFGVVCVPHFPLLAVFASALRPGLQQAWRLCNVVNSRDFLNCPIKNRDIYSIFFPHTWLKLSLST